MNTRREIGEGHLHVTQWFVCLKMSTNRQNVSGVLATSWRIGSEIEVPRCVSRAYDSIRSFRSSRQPRVSSALMGASDDSVWHHEHIEKTALTLERWTA